MKNWVVLFDSHLFLFTRFDNGSSVGMMAEVMDGTVDSSVAGFSTNVERFELVDFSPTLVSSIMVLVMKTPGQGDGLSFVTRKKYLYICRYIEANY